MATLPPAGLRSEWAGLGLCVTRHPDALFVTGAAQREAKLVCQRCPVIAECLMPIVVSVPLQLLAYYIAVYKDRNVDQPRNLAKSVTVE